MKIVIQILKVISHEWKESLPSEDFLCDTSLISLYGTTLFRITLQHVIWESLKPQSALKMEFKQSLQMLVFYAHSKVEHSP